MFFFFFACKFPFFRLKTIPRPKYKVCILGDQQHCDEAKANSVDFMNADDLKKLNKNKKLVKKLGRLCYLEYNAFSYLYIQESLAQYCAKKCF